MATGPFPLHCDLSRHLCEANPPNEGLLQPSRTRGRPSSGPETPMSTFQTHEVGISRALPAFEQAEWLPSPQPLNGNGPLVPGRRCVGQGFSRPGVRGTPPLSPTPPAPSPGPALAPLRVLVSPEWGYNPGEAEIDQRGVGKIPRRKRQAPT